MLMRRAVPRDSARARVLFVMPGLAGNGASRYVLDLAAGLAALGFGVEVFMLGPLELGEIPHGVVPAVLMTSGDQSPSRRQLWKLPRLLGRLVGAARRSDVVVAAWEVGSPLVAATLAGRATRRPVVVTVQSYASEELDHYYQGGAAQWASRRAWSHADAAVCVSEGLIDRLPELGIPKEMGRVIQNGIDVERTRALAAEPAPDWLPAGPYIAAPGRLTRMKAFDILIEAHARVLSETPHHLVILGEGEERASLERLIAILGVQDTVLMRGFETNPLPTMAGAEVVCLPSRFEGWGLVAAEALTVGTPVIASDRAGPRAVLQDGLFGELLEPTVDELAAALARHLRDPAPLRAKAQLGYDAAAEAFSIEDRARRYGELIDELASRKARV